eukprot:COSAG04_NODE_27500_length_282_cov_0.972678_1_plen_60_part_10
MRSPGPAPLHLPQQGGAIFSTFAECAADTAHPFLDCSPLCPYTLAGGQESGCTYTPPHLV